MDVSSRNTTIDSRVVVGVLAQIKSSIVYNVSLLHNVGTHGHVSPRSVLADCLKADIVVGVGCSGEALEHALLGKKQGADVDSEDGAFFGGALLMELDVLGEEIEGLRLILEHVEDALAARDDDDIEVLKLVVGVFVVHVGLDGEALDRRHGSSCADELALESLAGWRGRQQGSIETGNHG